MFLSTSKNVTQSVKSTNSVYNPKSSSHNTQVIKLSKRPGHNKEPSKFNSIRKIDSKVYDMTKSKKTNLAKNSFSSVWI